MIKRALAMVATVYISPLFAKRALSLCTGLSFVPKALFATGHYGWPRPIWDRSFGG